jgi:hypothetical protein
LVTVNSNGLPSTTEGSLTEKLTPLQVLALLPMVTL